MAWTDSDVARHLFVVRRFPRRARLTLGHRAQGNHVVEHFGQRHLALDDSRPPRAGALPSTPTNYFDSADAMSVSAKSSPLNKSVSPVAFANA
jgi:hypothetical protein